MTATRGLRTGLGGVALAAVLSSLLTLSCKTGGSQVAADTQPAAASRDAVGPALCVGLRGNGVLIMSHFASMARITEEFGVIGGTAGGSSASISQFIYESIYANPAVSQCGKAACSPEVQAARIALLLKSLQSYVTYVENTPTIVAFRHLYSLAQKLKSSTVGNRLNLGDFSAIDDLKQILSNSVVKEILNPEVATLLEHGSLQLRLQHAKEIYAGAIATPDYSDHLTDNIIFFRPGVVNFHALAHLVGRIGNFYAGYGPSDAQGMEDFLSACAAPSRGKDWPAVAPLATKSGTCGDNFTQLLQAYYQKLLPNEQAYPSRIDDPVGKYMHVLVATGLLEGADAVASYEASLANYRSGLPTNFNFDFSKVRFGYYGRTGDLSLVASNPRHYTDPKTLMFTPLGQDSWATALGYSPAEPGISRLQEMTTATPRISTAGWADVSPTHVLKNLGCGKVISVTRQWDTETPLAIGVVKLFGASQAQSDALYSLDVPAAGPMSSSLQAIADADGVWCPNTNVYKTLQVTELSANCYNAPMEVHDPALATYANGKPSLGLRGCTVGAPQGTGGH